MLIKIYTFDFSYIGGKKSPLIRQTFILGTSGGIGESLRKSYIVYISCPFSLNFQRVELILLR
jgi:hypothetical protein